MSARLQRREPYFQGFDAEGRRICVGSADVGVEDDEEVSARVWCLAPDGELLWWLEDDDVPSGQLLELNPARTELLLGSDRQFLRVDAASGSVLERGLKTELRGFGWAADGTLVGMDRERLVRRTLAGQPRPTWAKRGGLSGLVDGLVEPWMARTDSTLAMMVGGGVGNLVYASDRAIRIGNSARTITGPDGDLHLIQTGTVKLGKDDERWAVTWVRFDSEGTVLHRIVVPMECPTEDAVLDAQGRLWIRASPEKRHNIARIDPKSGTAQVVASSKKQDRIEGFAVDPQGELHLRTKKKVDTPEGEEASLEVVRRRSRFKPLAIVALLSAAAINGAGVSGLLANRDSLLNQAASGAPMRMKAGKTGHKMLQTADLEALAPGQLAYAVELGVFALGLLLLVIVALRTPVRAVSLSTAWVTVTAIVALFVNTAVTLRPMGGFDTFTLGGVPAFVHLCTWMALLFVSAAGPRLVK